MELRHFRYFVAVAEERSFLRAAERLHISQPPLSTQIKDLESELGVRLFERTSKGIKLTAPGEAFYSECRAVLARVEHARLSAQRADRGDVGNLSVGFVSIADYGLLPPSLKCFRTRYPGVIVELIELTTNIQVNELGADRLDVGIGIAPIDHPELVFELVLQESLIVAAPAGHPLIGDDDIEVDLRRLADERFVLPPRELAPAIHDSFMECCRASGFAPTVTQYARQMQTVISLVSNGFGFALVPSSLRNLQRVGVRYLCLKEPAPAVDIGLIYKRRGANPVVKKFVHAVKETALGEGGKPAPPTLAPDLRRSIDRPA